MAKVDSSTMGTETTHDTLPETYDRLDNLWTQYLQLLDDYTVAQANIQKHLAAGFLSLTQANFQSSGRRYGRDFYDDRALATARVVVEDDGEVAISSKTDGDSSDGKGEGKEETEEAKQLPSPSPTPEPDKEQGREEEDVDESGDPKEATQKSHITDPRRWFGILTPSSLRSAQHSFASAVLDECNVGKAVNAARAMKDIEADIRKLRKAIKKLEKGAVQT
ncbi:hypothetical protein PRZ48_013337 [Zasmidium cellare]|uniref:Vacuolar ATPase assembly protein VMA22 n=1 Tax=Zasmidium cellare TaxID=395010 RepID=A0ABR0E172_ZASCE|nr:hypothetical protein PRZ48_013337 [Zasmidium cellare]